MIGRIELIRIVVSPYYIKIIILYRQSGLMFSTININEMPLKF